MKPGDVLQDRYEIIGVLGVGGFGSVYKARDKRFVNVTRLCAIKEMVNSAPDAQMREITVKSFEREADILATLEHPSIPDVYDYFTADNRSYLVLEFIRGKDLEAILADSDKPLEQEKVLDWALQVCEVLGYLHRHKPQPILFRDVKPSNIMLDVYDRIHVIDFGIAKLFQTNKKHTMVGTDGYAPPEQYRGDSSPAGDIYALGATLHHLLTKQDPRLEVPFSFGERSIRAVNPTVTAAFEAIVMRCLSYAAIDRYQDGVALKEALEGMLAAEEEAAQEVTRLSGRAAAAPDGVAQGSTSPGPARGLQPLWIFKCEDEIRSSPLVARKMVLVGAYDNNLYALSQDTGEFLWKFPASDGIAGMAAVYEDAIFIGSADHYLYCLPLDGSGLKWRFAAEGAIYSSPRARFDHVFFGSDDGYLYAVNVNSGRVAWKTEAHSPVRSTPLVGEDRIYFGSEGGYVFCIDLAGKKLWQFQARRAVTSTPALADDLLFVGSKDNTIYALDANTGWAVWRVRANRPIISSPTIDKGVLFIGSSDGNLYAVDVSSGRVKWTYETGGQVSSTPAVFNDAVYFGSTDGFVYSLTTRKGELRWKFQTGGFVVSSPAVKNGTVYVGSADHNLYALPL